MAQALYARLFERLVLLMNNGLALCRFRVRVCSKSAGSMRLRGERMSAMSRNGCRLHEAGASRFHSGVDSGTTSVARCASGDAAMMRAGAAVGAAGGNSMSRGFNSSIGCAVHSRYA